MIVLGGVFKFARRAAEIKSLEAWAINPHLWDTPPNAKHLMQRLSRLNAEIAQWVAAERQITLLSEFIALSIIEGDASLHEEITTELVAIAEVMEALEMDMLLDGPYDDRNAFLSIKAVTNDDDAFDWVSMLFRMYRRWAENRDFDVTILDMSDSGIGIKRVVIELHGSYAYGFAKAEAGMHCLIRRSPFSTENTSQTLFALVEVLPQTIDEVEILPDALRIDVSRFRGYGGPAVHRYEAGVRLTYCGGTSEQVIVTCFESRSRERNKEMAMRLLQSKLLGCALRRQHEAATKLEGEAYKIEADTLIRTYQFHPRTLVHDHRSDYTTSDVCGMLDGALDPCIEAYLRWNAGRNRT